MVSKSRQGRTQQQQRLYDLFRALTQIKEIEEEFMCPGEHVFPKPVCH